MSWHRWFNFRSDSHDNRLQQTCRRQAGRLLVSRSGSRSPALCDHARWRELLPLRRRESLFLMLGGALAVLLGAAGRRSEAAGETLSVPSLAAWLANDDTAVPSGGTVRHAAPGASGAGSENDPGDLQAMLTASAPGDTVVAEGGFYEAPNGLSFPSGSQGSPVTLMAAPNQAAIISKDEEFAGARTPQNGFWTQNGLAQDDIDKKIWKSTQTFTASAARLYGVWIEFDHPHQMLAYNNMSELRATYGTADSPTNYAGPGAYLDADGTLYVRMQKPHPDKYSAGRKWQDHLWPGHPEAVAGGALDYPISEDPNDYEIRLFRRDGAEYAFDPTLTGGFIQVGPGINSIGYRQVITGHDIALRRGTHMSWRNFIIPSSDTDLRENYDVQRCRFSCGSKRHLSRAEWKFEGWLEGDRGAFIETTTAFASRNLNFKDCTIADFHEWATGAFSEWRFRNCAVFNILDDGFQTRPDSHRCEVGLCYILNSAIGGMGGGGTTPINRGEDYWHHNVIDQRVQKCTNWRAETTPAFICLQHSPDHDVPQKKYNNTVLMCPDHEEETTRGFNHLGQGQDNNENVPHEAFNNLFLMKDVQRYDVSQVSDISTNQNDYVAGFVSVDPDASGEFWDYNLYYRDVPTVGGLHDGFADGLLRGWRDSRAAQFNPDNFHFRSLDDWRNEIAYRDDGTQETGLGLFALSKTSGTLRGAYTPGFEANGTDAKPALPSLDDFPAERFDYRPEATVEVTVATTSSLSGADWWSTAPGWGADYFDWDGLAPSDWKGALDPNGTGLPVGVQNP